MYLCFSGVKLPEKYLELCVRDGWIGVVVVVEALGRYPKEVRCHISDIKKIDPWGPELIWYLSTKCKMGRQQVVPAVYHYLNHDNWGVADLTWQSYIPLDLK